MQDTVLIVAAPTATAEAVEYLVVDAGFAVRRAADGRQAAEALAACPCAAAVLDAASPDCGLRLLEILRPTGAARVPVAVLVSRADPVEREKARALGADAVFVKPFAGSDLVAALRRMAGYGPAAMDAQMAAADTGRSAQMNGQGGSAPHHG